MGVESRRVRRRIAVVVVGIAALVAACGDLPEVGIPTGPPLLPDIVPLPPEGLSYASSGGRTLMRFNAILANVGEGDFLVRATRGDDGEWQVSQEVTHEVSGASLRPVQDDLVWAGDGHEHWHIGRIVSYTLHPLSADGSMDPVIIATDTKIGFCFFDHTRELETGREEPTYEVHGCGHEDDDAIRMGLSVGWTDVYTADLPGQNVDITDVPDGRYRFVASVDEDGSFLELSEENNVAWLDLELKTFSDGSRVATTIDTHFATEN